MNICVASYNTRGLRVGHSDTDKSRRVVVDKLMERCDILCVQETFLAKQELDGLNSLHSNFHGAGESTTDLSAKVVRGRIPGGVATLWNKKYDQLVSVIRLGVDWAIGIELCCNDRKIIILNVYMPYECIFNEDEYLSRLAFIMSFIQDNSSTCIYVLGDMNADITDANSSFGNHLLQFCTDSGLILSSKVLLPNDSYTYISEAWHSTSWLDHCLCTVDAHDSIEIMKIEYDLATTDHIPFFVVLNTGTIPVLLPVDNGIDVEKINWSKISKQDLNRYVDHSDALLANIEVPNDALLCRDMNCKNVQHCKALCSLYEAIVESLSISSRPLYKPRKNLCIAKPGWKEYVEELHVEARNAFKKWAESGKSRHGPLFEIKKSTNARFKCALRYIKRNENIMRSDSLAWKLQNNNVNDFWKEIKTINNCKISLPSNIDGVSGPDEISQLWRKHYCELLNCVKSNLFVVDNVEYNDDVVITSSEIHEAILKLRDNKACGPDHITAEHLKLASKKLCPLVAMCYTGFFVHGELPDSMLSVELVPVIKDKVGKLNSSDNYRPIALASVMSKVLETVVLCRLERYVLSTDNQFGFKRKHGTDLCIFALKEILDRYNKQNSTMFLCFIDASKAFDRVNHQKLFLKLIKSGVPGFLIRILVYWYSHQTMRVKWGRVTTAPFKVTNGVRQGGILSPFLFNVYMNDLSMILNACGTGCRVGDSLINHLMYADDLVIFSPYSAGIQQLLRLCTQYGVDFDIKYNPKKSKIMTIRSRDDKHSHFPDFYLSGTVLDVCTDITYLGHIIANDLSDDKDIYRQRRKLYVQANMLCRKFSMCSVPVKISLFRTYCTPLYTAYLWCRYKQDSIRKLTVAYNDSMRLLLRVPRDSSASHMFVSAGVPTCAAVLRNLMFRFMGRVSESKNDLIAVLANPRRSSVRFSSRLWNHWCTCLYVRH